MPPGVVLPTAPRDVLLLRSPVLPNREEDGEERGDADEDVVRECEGRGLEEGGEGLPFICGGVGRPGEPTGKAAAR